MSHIEIDYDKIAKTKAEKTEAAFKDVKKWVGPATMKHWRKVARSIKNYEGFDCKKKLRELRSARNLAILFNGISGYYPRRAVLKILLEA